MGPNERRSRPHRRHQLGVVEEALQAREKGPAHRRRVQDAPHLHERRSGLVGLADQLRAAVAGQAAQQAVDLVLDQRVLRLDHDDLVEAVDELEHPLGLQRERHRHLVDRDAELAGPLQRQPQPGQPVDHVQVGLARRDDPQSRGQSPRRRAGRVTRSRPLARTKAWAAGIRSVRISTSSCAAPRRHRPGGVPNAGGSATPSGMTRPAVADRHRPSPPSRPCR